MIEIHIPKVDYIVTLENVRDIPYNTSGIYIIYDEKGSPLYVGQASCLRSRIYSHFTGQGGNNTQRYAWTFYECKVFIEDDPASKNVYECYFINFLKPPLNKNINPNPYRGEKYLFKKTEPQRNHPAYCQFVLDNGTQCALRPHLNGYCHLHGGNGLSRQSFIDKAIEEYEKLAEVVYQAKSQKG